MKLNLFFTTLALILWPVSYYAITMSADGFVGHWWMFVSIVSFITALASTLFPVINIVDDLT